MARFCCLVILVLASGCAGLVPHTYQSSVRDLETGKPLATKYVKTGLFNTEVTYGCRKRELLDDTVQRKPGEAHPRVMVDCDGAGLFTVPATMAERYWNTGAGGYQFPGYFMQGYAQPVQPPHPYTAAAVPQDARAAAVCAVPGSCYQYASWVFSAADCRPLYSPYARVVQTYGGTHYVEPPRPQCWKVDLWGSGKKFWTGECGLPRPQCN